MGKHLEGEKMLHQKISIFLEWHHRKGAIRPNGQYRNLKKGVKRVNKKKETETKRKLEKTLQSHIWFTSSSVLFWSVLQVHSAFLDKQKPHRKYNKTLIDHHGHTYMQKHPHTTPYKTNYSKQKLALYVFNQSLESLEKHSASEMECKGTTKGRENIVLSPSIPTNFIQRILENLWIQRMFPLFLINKWQMTNSSITVLVLSTSQYKILT